MRQGEGGFSRQTMSGEVVTVGGVAVTPQSEALSMRWPRGGWVWNRPVAVVVERGDERKRMPIVDVTRVAQLALYGLSVVFAMVGLALMIGQRRSRDE